MSVSPKVGPSTWASFRTSERVTRSDFVVAVRMHYRRSGSTCHFPAESLPRPPVTARRTRSKVMTLLTPRLRQLARWQRSRAPSAGNCSWSCRANVTSSPSSGHTCTRDRTSNAIAASSASSLATGRYAWTNSCKTSADVHRGVRFPLHVRKKSRAAVRSGWGRPTAYMKILVSTKIMFRWYRLSAIR